jgi:hypothetical protein
MHAGPNVSKSRKSQFSVLKQKGKKEEDEMRVRYAILYGVVIFCLLTPIAVLGQDTSPAVPVANHAAAAAPDPLLQLLVSKGVLSAEEAKSLNGTPAQQRAQLLELLRRKGVLSAADYDSLTTPPASAQVAPNLVASTTPILPAGVATNPAPEPQPTKPAPPKFVPAVAPVRVLPVDAPVKGKLIPALKLGAISMTPYGFIKATVAHDSSDPRGDDFIVPGFLNTDTGPNTNPAFHIKARATRFGANFEWPDMENKLTLTGKIEADFEGNFSRVDNRNVSTVRSNMPQLRLAFARLDYAASDKTDLFLEGGQDWTLYGSTVLPNLLETTFLGAYWGDTYERSPQIRFGLVQKLGGSRNFKFLPEFAIMMPSEGLTPGDATLTSCTIPDTFAPGTTTTIGCSSTFVNGLGNQLGYGERTGADAGRPELEARAVLQWQLDNAPGVAPAQLVVSGFDSRREAVVLRSAIAAPAGSSDTTIANYAAVQAAFPHGATSTSEGYGVQGAIQLPTRWITLVASAYRGADMRFFFAGQLQSIFNDTGGLTNTVTAPSVDRASTVAFGQDAAGNVILAPQRSVRGYGGFVQVGLPLSRWFKANPAGRNAGWQLYFHSGLDAVNHSDFARAKGIGASGGGPWRSVFEAVSLFNKINSWCTFGYEVSLYSSYALPNAAGVYTSNTSVAGVPSRTWRDLREEFGPIFSF